MQILPLPNETVEGIFYPNSTETGIQMVEGPYYFLCQLLRSVLIAADFPDVSSGFCCRFWGSDSGNGDS